LLDRHHDVRGIEAARDALVHRIGDLARRRHEERWYVEVRHRELPQPEQPTVERQAETERERTAPHHAAAPSLGPRAPSAARTRGTCGPTRSVSTAPSVRGGGKSTSTASRTAPGRGVNTMTRPPRNTASAIEWVMNSTVTRRASHIRCSSTAMAS